MGERQTTKFTLVLAVMITAGAILCLFPNLTHAQSTRDLTPVQAEIERKQQRLSSGDEEDRRDALTRLAALHRVAASRAALPALSDSSPIIRVTAEKAILSLDPAESATALLPLLNDKD